MMDYQSVIDKYYPDGVARDLLIKHSRQVADHCLAICDRHPELKLDRDFLEEAAMLHDIGIQWCSAPGIHCHGAEPYLRHGPIGGELLRHEGWERHARVAERHTGTGLPGLEPETLEEQVVCYADKFYSKSHPDRVLTVEEAAQSLGRFGHQGVEKFLSWAKRFMLIFAGFLLTACERIVLEEENGQEPNSTKSHVVIRIADADTGWDGANSRSPVRISEVCNRLQISVYQDGKQVKKENQIVGDSGYGIFSFQLEEGTYQLLTLGHSGANNITTTKPEKLQFTNPGASNGTGFTDTFYYYGDMTVNSDGALLDISMKRATSMFRLKTTDAKPANVKKFRFYYTGGSGALDATTGFGCVNSKQTVVVELDDTAPGQTLSFEMYTFLHQENGTVTFTVSALGDNDDILYEKEFKAQMKRNCITQYTGRFFTDEGGETPDTPDTPPSGDEDEPPADESSSYVIYVDPEWANVFEYTY